MSARAAPPTEAPVVTGVGALSAHGDGAEALWTALAEGRPLPILRRAEDADDPALAARVLALARGGAVARLRAFDDRRFTGAERRRMNRLGRIAVTCAGQALVQAGLESAGAGAGAGGGAGAGAGGAEGPATAGLDDARRARAGVTVGTGYGSGEDAVAFLDGVAQRGAEFGNPALFPTSVLNAPAAQVSMRFKLRGHGATFASRDLGGELALCDAVEALALGRADAIVAGACDEALALHAAALRRLRLLCTPPRRPALLGPHDGRGGLELAEGAAFLVVERAGEARARGARPLAAIASWSAACAPVTGPIAFAGDDGAALARAALEALAAAGVGTADLGLVVAGATGLAAQDQAVAGALARLAPERALPLCAPVATTGWFPGAGALALAAAVMAIARQTLPAPSPGLRPPAGYALPDAHARNAPVEAALVLATGVGGQSVALVVTRATRAG